MTSRTVLITGGAGGIGKAIAEHFSQRGDTVVITDVAETVADIAAAAGVHGLQLDITDSGSISRGLEQVEQDHGAVDVLVNNAGVLSKHGMLTEFREEDMDLILRTNVLGTFLMSQQVAKQMIANKTRGTIVNISSIGGRQPTPGMGAYESSKAAVDSLTRWAAIELAEHGIRVNAVAPGPVLTEMLALGMPEGSPQRAAWESRIPLRKLASVTEVAEVVGFVASPAASHLTGVNVPVDGGQLLV